MKKGDKTRQPKLNRNIQKEVDDILRGVAKEYDISIDQVEEIHSNPFRFLREHLLENKGEEESLKDIRILYFGTFRVSKKKINKLKNKNNEGF